MLLISRLPTHFNAPRQVKTHKLQPLLGKHAKSDHQTNLALTGRPQERMLQATVLRRRQEGQNKLIQNQSLQLKAVRIPRPQRRPWQESCMGATALICLWAKSGYFVLAWRIRHWLQNQLFKELRVRYIPLCMCHVRRSALCHVLCIREIQQPEISG